jgi:hypothetical protein
MRIGHPGRNRGYNDQLLGSSFLRLDLFQMVNLSITEAVCYRSNQEECWFSLLVVISPLVALMADQVAGSRGSSNSNTKTIGPMIVPIVECLKSELDIALLRIGQMRILIG